MAVPQPVTEWLKTAGTEDLEAMQGRIVERLEAVDEEADAAAREAIEEVLRRRGKDYHELYGLRKARAAVKLKGKPLTKPKGQQYQHPVTKELAGKPRGNPKAWLGELLGQGFRLEEFEVQGDGSIGGAAKTWEVVDGEVQRAMPAAGA